MKISRLHIESNLKKNEFLPLLIKQVEKDLEVDFQIVMDSENILESLKSKLTIYISEMLSESPNDLFVKLYRVDINEKELRDVLLSNKDFPYDKLSSLIIEREAKKILYRKHYSLLNKNP